MKYDASYWLSLIQVNYPPRKTVLRYGLHKLIWQAFPGFPPDSIQPFLFTITGKGDENGLYCLVQSLVRPEWRHVNTHDGDGANEINLTKVQGIKPVNFAIHAGDLFSFRLHACPIKNKFVDANVRGRKVRMTNRAEINNWFSRKANEQGFLPCRYEFDSRKIKLRTSFEKNAPTLSWTACQFDGVLQVNDVEKFFRTIVCGVGPKKTFGFSMMTIGSA